MKTRHQLISEAGKAVESCWNHYSDEPLEYEILQKVWEVLSKLLPAEVSTAKHQEYVGLLEAERRAAEEPLELFRDPPSDQWPILPGHPGQQEFKRDDA